LQESSEKSKRQSREEEQNLNNLNATYLSATLPFRNAFRLAISSSFCFSTQIAKGDGEDEDE
jgi:hypothetical protein